MDIYHYDPATGALTGVAQAEASPLEDDVWLIPANATSVAPTAAQPLTCPVFDAAAKTWSLVPDYRGQPAWSTTTALPVAVTELGKTLADLGLTAVEPPAGPVKWDGAAWQPDAVAIKAAHNAPILAQIAALDVFVPRGLEDAIAAYGWDVTKLPAVQQERLAQKAALRAQLQA
ncbi:MAG TPA: hypothetical protein VK558_07810 [Patescibacteria group bacterium]|nr:hypothetical protein [Patescibacteria group bacterium]